MDDELQKLEGEVKTLETEIVDLEGNIYDGLQEGFRITMENRTVRNIQKRCKKAGYPVGLDVTVLKGIAEHVAAVSEKNETLREHIAKVQDEQRMEIQKANELLVRSGFKLDFDVSQLPATCKFASTNPERSANNDFNSK